MYTFLTLGLLVVPWKPLLAAGLKAPWPCLKASLRYQAVASGLRPPILSSHRVTHAFVIVQRLVPVELLMPKMKSHVEDKTESGKCDIKILIYLKFC